MNETEILEWMKGWVERNKYEFTEPFGECLVTDVIDSSMDVVEFTMEMEEAMGAEEEIDLEEMAPKFATLTFAQLAGEIVKYAG